MDILTKITGLAHIGLGPLFRAMTYGLRRDLSEMRLIPRPSPPETTPGRVVGAEAVSSGARLAFDRADLEVRFLAPDLLRLTWRPGVLPVPYSLARTDWPEVGTVFSSRDSDRIVQSEQVLVAVGPDGSVRLESPPGRVLREELPPALAGERWIHRAPMHASERCFGLGLRSSPLNLRGGGFSLWNSEAMGAYGPGDDPLYLCIPVYLGTHDNGSYLVFFENSFDGDMEFDGVAQASFSGGALREYFIPGPPARALDRYTELTGRPFLPPRWALGFHQARWSYMSEAEVREVAGGFIARDLPISAIHIDIDYMEGFRVFTSDKARFPDMPRLAEHLAANGVRLVVNHDPGVKKDDGFALYRDGMQRGVFLGFPDGRPVEAPVWPGTCVFPDFTDHKAREWWGEQYKVFMDWGLSGVWHDMNEPAAFTPWGRPTLPESAIHAFDGRGGDHREGHNLFALLEVQAGHEAMRRMRPDRRPWLLSRSGWAGLQRWSWNWSGDTETNWWTLRQTVRQAIALGLSGAVVTGPDIGGFGGDPPVELFVRWFELGAFLPFFRVHSAFFTPRREPWCFGAEALEILRGLLRLRYRLIPYLYTLAWESSVTGAPLVRPVWWNHPTEAALLDVDDEFLLGDALLVAPILEQGATARDVSLPPGQWYSWWDDRVSEGGGKIRVESPLGRIPLFVRGGSVVPAEEGKTLVLHVFPDRSGRAGGAIYNDEGDGWGPRRTDRIAVERQGAGFVVTRTSEGDYSDPARELKIQIHGPEARSTPIHPLFEKIVL